MNNALILALKGQNQGPPPVWFMRQAGRALPSYRALRERHSLADLFHSPEMIEKVTRMPVELLGVDAAILFSDILIPLEALGYELHYRDGQAPTVTQSQACDCDWGRIDYLFEGIERLKSSLYCPLIGFAGGPYTVATYITENPSTALLETITELTIEYAKRQIQCGVQAFQIFDSWAGLLDPATFAEKVTPYLKKICEALKAFDIPVILFTRGIKAHLSSLIPLAPHAFSVDWECPIEHYRDTIPRHIALQGNLDPQLLLQPETVWGAQADAILSVMGTDPGYIFNLGHGLLPETPFEHIQKLIEKVRSYEAI